METGVVCHLKEGAFVGLTLSVRVPKGFDVGKNDDGDEVEGNIHERAGIGAALASSSLLIEIWTRNLARC